jgi:hypothetical protein
MPTVGRSKAPQSGLNKQDQLTNDYSGSLYLLRFIFKMKTIFFALTLIMVLSGTARADYRRYCDSVSTNAEAFTEERKKGYTKKQVQENARLMAQQRELDPSVLEAWYAEIEWVFSGAQKRYGPVASRQRRLDECLANEGK